jgi:UDP-2,3-diacylglucosamine pyrophosphatase LpxH
MITVVSDIHIGFDRCNKEDFLRFLDTCNTGDIDHLVLLGDIMDFWRRNNAQVVVEKENEKILAKLINLNVKNIYYSYPHNIW